MKKKITLKRILIAVSAVLILVVGSVFLLMYSQREVDQAPEEDGFEAAQAQPAFVITPKTFGSYGELMFAYIGEHNYLYNLDDESRPLIEQPADELLYASDDTVIYTAPVETDADHYGRESMIQELQIGEKENTLNTIATVSIDPCWSSNDEVVYFVKDDNKKQLCTFEPLTSTTEEAAVFKEDVSALRISSDGLLVTTASGQELLYIPLSKQLTAPYCDSSGSRLLVCEQYDLILTPEGALSYRWIGSNEATLIAQNVIVPCGYQDNEVLYIQQTDGGPALCAFYVSEEQTKELAKLPKNILPQLTVSADYAFVMDDDFIVYRLLLDNNEFAPFCQIKKGVKNPLISVFDYRLMVYDLSAEADATYAYSIDATAAPDEKTAAALKKLQKQSADSDSRDASYMTLEMASVGEAVSALQSRLNELGYLPSGPNGIYDVATTVAVQYLQSDFGMEESGVSSPALQQKLMTEKLGSYKGSAISATAAGITVRDFQARLIALGYLKGPVTGKMDDATEKAFALFAKDNGIDYDGGVIKTEDITKLNKSDAAYGGYLPLFKGDTCSAVTKLNARLKKLGYLSGSVNPCYDAKTETAVKLYQQVNDLPATGKADTATLKSLYAKTAAACPADRTPAAVNDSLSVNKGQVISDRQLKIIRKWLTKQFAVNHTDRQAVKRLQRQLVKLGYMKASAVSMIYDKPTMNAVVAFQRANNLDADGIATKSTLTEIFSTTINNSQLKK